jgi:hypothetical protein
MIFLVFDTSQDCLYDIPTQPRTKEELSHQASLVDGLSYYMSHPYLHDYIFISAPISVRKKRHGHTY